MSLKSGHKIIPVYGREQEKQMEDFTGYGVGTIRLQPDGWFLTTPFIRYADKVYDFKFKPTDVLVMTYPKCGTTWTQEIIWTMRNNPDLTNPLGNILINFRSPFLESDFLMQATNVPPLEPGNEIYDMFTKTYPGKNPEDGIMLQIAESTPDPRTIKTHLPLSLFKPFKLLDTCKVVYVAREPKDVVVSYYHHTRIIKAQGFVGDLQTFVNRFVNDTLLYSPFWTNLKEAWAQRHHPNLHFIFYEDLKADPKAEICRLQTFLGTSLSDDQINKIVKYTSFAEMKKRDNMIGDAANDNSGKSFVNVEVIKQDGGFFRKGETGDGKKKLTKEQARIIDEWTMRNVEKDFGSSFKYAK